MIDSNNLRDLLAAPGVPTLVEYTPTVLDDIRDRVARNFAETSGPVEIAGVLFGTFQGNRVVVKALEEVRNPDQHAALFIPDEDHHLEFERTLDRSRSSVGLRGLSAVGWFVSHARDSLVMRATDQQIYDRHFPDEWQVTIVIRPGRTGALRAATYVRAGNPPAPSMLNVLDLDSGRNSVLIAGEGASRELPPDDDGPRVEAENSLRQIGPVLPARQASASRREIVTPVPPDFSAVRGGRFRERPGSKWRAWVLLLFVLAAAAAGVYFFYPSSEAAVSSGPVNLQVMERDGILLIEWDGNSAAIAGAQSGRIEITDGDAKKSFPLTRTELRKGAFPVIRKNADLSARLVFEDRTGKLAEEVTRYLGKPVTPRQDQSAAALDELQRQNEALRQELLHERSRANELQSWVDVLESSMKKREGRQ